jgi:cytidylate kinase
MPIVVIARGSLTGGQATAERVARQLGVPAVGRERLIELASKFGLPGPRIAQLLDTSPTFWERFQESRETYVTYLRAAMCEVAEGGQLVYHGHFGQELLSGVDNILRVRVIAPMAYRVAAAMEERQITRDAAIAYIKRADEDRLKRGQQLFGLNWTDPSLYDLVINLDALTEDMAAEIIVRAAQLPRFEDSAGLLRQIHDVALATKVNVALLANGWILHVAAEDGRVRLTGEVHLLPSDKLDDLERIASAVEGVQDVTSDIDVVPVPPVATPY